ncbi:MAG: ATP-binding cassette domain-containing protein [Anaerolineaceae bacterium]|nr:ATP-binding cassette domain-containing protein [Anaerolineaceae bacterium]
MSENDAFIQLNNIHKIFQTAAGQFPALKGISVNFSQSEFVSVVGRSGSGKSTLVNMITGIDKPTNGEVIISGTEIHKLQENDMATWRGRNLGIVFQFYQLLPIMTLLENVMLPMELANLYTPVERKKRAMELLDLVGVAKQASKRPASVSGGQQQSAAIARALANDPPIVVADEPTGNLDSTSAENIFQIFNTLTEQGKTIIMVTHDNDLAKRAQRIMLISDGEVVNETIASTLPLLTHGQMLKATRSSEELIFEPGEPIIKQGQTVRAFYMITQGLVDVSIRRRNAEMKIASMGPGQYFGEIELLTVPGATAIATITANVRGPVRMLTLNRKLFNELMEDAVEMKEEIRRIARERFDDNKISRRAHNIFTFKNLQPFRKKVKK